MENQMQECRICPRDCGADRLHGKKGYCRMGADPMIARAALHMWEEPCISGKKGSGAVFFSGCSLGCIFCQNHEIALGNYGEKVSPERLSEIFFELKEQGAKNINLVTGEHYAPQIASAVERAKNQGLSLPVIYNSGGYEKVETLKILEGLVDVYLPDLKYLDPVMAESFSHAKDYPETAKKAIEEMIRQKSSCRFDEEGYIHEGVIVRHLVMPAHIKNTREVLRYLKETYDEKIYISIMNQYTPVVFQETFPELNRKVTAREYRRVLEFALEIGIEQAYFQEGETAKESFIPMFDGTGTKKDF